MIEIKTLTEFRAEDLRAIMSGYVSSEKYVVARTHTPDDALVSFNLQRVTLETPYIKRWDHWDSDDLMRYSQYVQGGFSIGAYTGARLVGIAIAEKHEWNKSLWIWEFGVADDMRGKGIGQQMMAELATRAKAHKLRSLVVETQNTNMPAIRFYRRMGFEFDAVDLSLYLGTDAEGEEVAFFMKKQL